MIYIISSFALEESTDIKKNPKLAVFVRCVSSDVTLKEEMLDFVALGETTRKNAFDRTLTNADYTLNKLVGVPTDRAPVIVGKIYD